MSQAARQLTTLHGLAAPLLPLLAASDTLDVVGNGDGSLWVNRLGRGWECESQLDCNMAELMLNGIATIRQRSLNHENPVLETIFPLTGDRIEGLIAPIVENPVFAIRTRQKQIYSIDALEASGIFTDGADPLNQKRHKSDFAERVTGCNHAQALKLACRYRFNMLLVGPTGSGKTSLANSIIAEWSLVTPQDRVVMIEDTPELQCGLPNHIALLATAAISQADLLVASLRLIPKRLVIGEVREEEPARVLLSAWNTGHSGGLATIHANDAASGLRKLETLVGGHEASVRERIAASVNLVVFIDGEDSLPVGRKVREVCWVRGLNPGGDYALEYL